MDNEYNYGNNEEKREEPARIEPPVPEDGIIEEAAQTEQRTEQENTSYYEKPPVYESSTQESQTRDFQSYDSQSYASQSYDSQTYGAPTYEQPDEESKKQPRRHMSSMVIFGDEEVLCKDAITGRTFRSTAEKIRGYCNNISEDLLHFGPCPLNDFYAQIHIGETGIGDELGWDGGVSIKPEFRPVLLPSGSPAVEVVLTPAPQPNWFKIG